MPLKKARRIPNPDDEARKAAQIQAERDAHAELEKKGYANNPLFAQVLNNLKNNPAPDNATDNYTAEDVEAVEAASKNRPARPKPVPNLRPSLRKTAGGKPKKDNKNKVDLE